MVQMSLAMIVAVAPQFVASAWSWGKDTFLEANRALEGGDKKEKVVLGPRRSPSLSDCLESSSEDESSARSLVCTARAPPAEQRLAARRAARAEAREIRMRELERQQREQEHNADKAYDMYNEAVCGRRGGGARLSSSALSPRRASEDSDEPYSLKDLRHELKETEEKFRKAMILNAQLDNDKAALGYQLELLKDRIEELHEQHAQLQREHKEKCSLHERCRRELAATQRELALARAACVARDRAIRAAGLALVDAPPDPAAAAAADPAAPAPGGDGAGAGGEDEPLDALVPALAIVSAENNKLLEEAGEGTLDVRLGKLAAARAALESEVRRLKLQLNDEQDRQRRHNGTAGPDHDDTELEAVRKSCAEWKGRAGRAEAEALVLGGAVARLEAQLGRLRARQDDMDEHEEALKQERRRLQREVREGLTRIEELETENSHLTKRLDKLKNAKSALLKEL